MAELACHAIEVQFGGLRALSDVELRVPPGRVTGLIGPNGAGKTTLFNVVTGLQLPKEGRVTFDDRDITRLRPARRSRLGLARTFQRLELFGSLTTRENIQMAAETQRTRLPAGTSPLAEAERLIDRVGLRSVADEPTDSLPTGQARLVELARALATRPRILLLDEPSAGLNHEETADLGHLLSALAAEGTGVLLVEHDMALVMGVCHTITVLDFGEVIASGQPDQVKMDPKVQAAYLGTDEDTGASRSVISPGPLKTVPGAINLSANGSSTNSSGVAFAADGLRSTADRQDSSSTTRKIMLELQDVRAAYGRIEVVHGVSMSIAQGSVTALLGPNGAGKSTLLKVASGIMQPSSGRVSFDGKPLLRSLPERVARRGLCTIPEGRAIFPNLTVAENLRMFTYRGREVTQAELEEKSFERFPVLGKRSRQLAGRLSGGEQQMLALSRALYTNPDFLLLDELSMGLAPLVVAQLYEAVGQLVERERLTVLLVEQFAATALAIADEACIMVTGEIIERGSPEDIGERLSSTYFGTAC